MRAIETTATVTDDGLLTVQLPPSIQPGPHRVVIVIEEPVGDVRERRPLKLPVHDSGPWPEGLSLRREDMYDDQGR